MILAFCIYQGRMPVYHADGFRQHVRAMTYYAKYLRGIFYHILVEHSLDVQAFTFGLGYGSDVLTTLQYYCVGDPLALPVAFLPTGWVAYWYMFLILLRGYLAGLGFTAYARYMQHTRGTRANETSIAIGAMVYSLCGQTIYLSMLHPFFGTPMYVLPLMLLGVEIYLNEHRGAPFAAATALGAVSNFYYFYMLAVLVAMYGIYRAYMTTAPGVREESTARGRLGRHLFATLRCGLPMVGYAVLGCVTAGATLFPILVQFVTDPRAATTYEVPLLYSASYYQQQLRNMIAYINHPDYDTEMSFGILAIMCLFMLFVRKGHRHLKRAYLVLLLVILVPALGAFVNGMTFVINRWSWCYDLAVAYVVAVILPEAETLTRRDKTVITILTALYTVLLWAFGFMTFQAQSTNYGPWNVCLSCALMWVVVLVLWMQESRKARQGQPARPRLQSVLAVICALSVGVNIYSAYSPLLNDFSSEFVEAESPSDFETTLYSNEASSAADIMGRDGFFRYSGRDLTWNAAMLDGVSSTQFEFSFCNGTITNFFQDLGVVERQNFAFYGLDDRMIPLMMAGVNLYSLQEDTETELRFVPYGYADLGALDGYHYYYSELAMPLGYTYSGYIPRSAYEQLTTNERTEALVYGAVVEDEDAAALREEAVTPTLRSQEIDYEITDVSGLTMEDGVITVEGAKASMTLTFDGLADCETYLAWDNLLVGHGEMGYDITCVSMAGDEELVTKELDLMTPLSENYSGWKDYTLNMGYSSTPRTAIRVTFDGPATYTYDDMRIVCQPLVDIALDAQQLKAEQLTNVDMHKNPVSYATNLVTGDITVSTDKILCLNIPYSSGWTATVDGEPATLIKANDMFMALDLPAGTHRVELHYHTPGGVAGDLLSVAGVVILIVIAVRERRRNGRDGRNAA